MLLADPSIKSNDSLWDGSRRVGGCGQAAQDALFAQFHSGTGTCAAAPGTSSSASSNMYYNLRDAHLVGSEKLQ